jgi:hypothetical protein
MRDAHPRAERQRLVRRSHRVRIEPAAGCHALGLPVEGGNAMLAARGTGSLRLGRGCLRCSLGSGRLFLDGLRFFLAPGRLDLLLGGLTIRLRGGDSRLRGLLHSLRHSLVALAVLGGDALAARAFAAACRMLAGTVRPISAVGPVARRGLRTADLCRGGRLAAEIVAWPPLEPVSLVPCLCSGRLCQPGDRRQCEQSHPYQVSHAVLLLRMTKRRGPTRAVQLLGNA